jgi:antitoxin YefM
VRTISYSEARATLASLMDSVQDGDPVVVTRSGSHKSVVMVSMAEYSALHETARLLSTSANRRRLLDALESLKVPR